MGDKSVAMPNEYLEYLVCRTFHKLPSEVEREAARDILQLLTILEVESEIAEARRREGL